MGNEITKFGQVEIPLNGIQLDGIDISEDSIAIRLNTPQGPIIGVCDADCCSETWIENIDLPVLGFPCTVVGAMHLDMPEGRESEGDEPQEFIEFYGLKLVTNKGEIIIDYRNASNGYYGGSLEWSPDHYYGGVYGQQTKSGWMHKAGLTVKRRN